MTAIRSICFSDLGGSWMRLPSGFVAEVMSKNLDLAQQMNMGAVPSKTTVDFVYLEADDAYPLFRAAAAKLGHQIDVVSHSPDPKRSAVRSMADWDFDLLKTGFLGAELKLSSGEMADVTGYNRPPGHGCELTVVGRETGNTYWIPTSELLAFAESIHVPSHILQASGIEGRPAASDLGIDLSQIGERGPSTPSSFGM